MQERQERWWEWPMVQVEARAGGKFVPWKFHCFSCFFFATNSIEAMLLLIVPCRKDVKTHKKNVIHKLVIFLVLGEHGTNLSSK